MDDPVAEEHLKEVTAQIRIGAQPLDLTDAVADEMKGRYREDFEDEGNQAHWNDDQLKILALARMVGHLATFLTFAKNLTENPGAAVPTAVDSDCAYWAGFILSRTICPSPPWFPRLLGKHCEHYPNPDGVVAEWAMKVVREAIRPLLGSVRGWKLDGAPADRRV